MVPSPLCKCPGIAGFNAFCPGELELCLFLTDKYLVGCLTRCFNKHQACLVGSFWMRFAGLLSVCHLLLTIPLFLPDIKAGVVLDLGVWLSPKQIRCLLNWQLSPFHVVLLGHAGALVLVCCFSRGPQLLEECEPVSLYCVWSSVWWARQILKPWEKINVNSFLTELFVYLQIRQTKSNSNWSSLQNGCACIHVAL